MRERHQTQAWKAEAFAALSDRLRDFEVALHGRRLLELRAGPEVGFGFLLDWLRPSRLVAVDVESPHAGDARAALGAAEPCYGPDAGFEAAFLLAHDQLKRALRRVSLPEVARVLVPGGLLVVMSLDRTPESATMATREARANVTRTPGRSCISHWPETASRSERNTSARVGCSLLDGKEDGARTSPKRGVARGLAWNDQERRKPTKPQ